MTGTGVVPLPAARTRAASGRESLGIDRIRELLPHRWPMLLVDRVDSVGPGPRITGVKSVSGAEPWFQGHFPRHAVLPGVIAVEALAQLSGLLASLVRVADGAGDGAADGATVGANTDVPDAVYFTGVRSARFLHPIVPGDQMVMTSERVAGTAGFAEYRASATVNGHVAVKAQLTLAESTTPRRQEG